MTPTEIIIDALKCKASKLRRKAGKAQRDGSPPSHVNFLYDSAQQVENTRADVESGTIELYRLCKEGTDIPSLSDSRI